MADHAACESDGGYVVILAAMRLCRRVIVERKASSNRGIKEVKQSTREKENDRDISEIENTLVGKGYGKRSRRRARAEKQHCDSHKVASDGQGKPWWTNEMPASKLGLDKQPKFQLFFLWRAFPFLLVVVGRIF